MKVQQYTRKNGNNSDTLNEETQVPENECEEISMSAIQSFVISLASGKNFTLHLWNRRSSYRFEALNFRCRPSKPAEGSKHQKNGQSCPYTVKMIRYGVGLKFLRVKIEGRHNHILTDDGKMNDTSQPFLHYKLHKWITDCLWSGLSVQDIYQASITGNDVAGVGRMPTVKANKLSSKNSLILVPTVKQIKSNQRMIEQAHQRHVSDSKCYKRLFGRYSSQVVYASTFIDSTAMNLLNSIRNHCKQQQKNYPWNPDKPNELFICVLQTKFMQSRMLDIQFCYKGCVVLRCNKVEELQLHGRSVIELLYRNEYNNLEVISYIVLSEERLELLAIALKKLSEVGLLPDLALIAQWDYVVGAYKYIFGEAFPIFISTTHIIETWTKWLNRQDHHPIDKVLTEADRSLILEKVHELATISQDDVFEIVRLSLLKLCQQKGLKHVIQHYNEKYGCRCSTIPNLCLEKCHKKMTSTSCLECWCLLYRKEVAKRFQKIDKGGGIECNYAKLTCEIGNTQSANLGVVINQLIHVMASQKKSLKAIFLNSPLGMKSIPSSIIHNDI